MMILISTMEVKYPFKVGVQRPYEVKCGILAGGDYNDRLIFKVHHINKHNFIRQVRLLPVK